MKKIIALLLALIMIVSAVALTACGDENETEAPTEAPTEEATEAPAPEVDDNPYPVNELKINGIDISEYVISCNTAAGGVIPYAASELQRYIELTTGVKLEISETPVPAGTKRIAIDETIVTDSENYKYYTDADGLVIAGSAKRSAIYAVYNFLETCLGWRFFTEDTEVCYDADSIDLKNVNKEVVQVYRIRDIYANSYFSLGISLKRYQNGDGKRHALYNSNPESVNYGGSENFHQNGIHTFAYLSDTSESTQPCLNNEDIYNTMLAEVLAWLEESGSNMVHISQNDNRNYCQCSECSADIEYYGAPSGTIIEFCNRIDEDIKAAGYKDITVITFAYQYSFACPQNIKCNDDIAIELCASEFCSNHAYNDPNCAMNAAAMVELDKWAEICDEFYLWDYAINFAYMLAPWPNLDNILANTRTLAEIGAVGIMSQANYQNGNNSAEFEALRSYLIAKCLEDPYMSDADYYNHMDEFLKAYYGDGWVYVRNFIDFIHELSSKVETCYGWGAEGSPEVVFGDHAFEPYNELLIEWWDKAEELAETELQLEHVRRSRLCCDYLRIGAIHHQAYDVRDAMRETVKEYYNELKELGVTRIAENFAIPNTVGRDANPRAWWGMHQYED